MILPIYVAVMRVLVTIPILFATIGLYGCSGDGDGLDENGRPLITDDGTDPVGIPDVVTRSGFSDIQNTVFTPTCAVSGCHSGSSAPFGLQLDSDVAYDNLVSQLSIQQNDTLRVAPGDPDNSYLIQKLEGTATTGSRMPRNQPPLPESTIEVIRQWIADGALRDE